MTTRSTAVPIDRPSREKASPDYCNLGIVLRVLLVLYVGAALCALPTADSLRDAVNRFLILASVLSPSALLSLCALCALTRRLSAAPPWERMLLGGTIAGIATLLTDLLIVLIVPVDAVQLPGGFHPFALALPAAGIGAAVVHFYELRARAMSPALSAARLQALQSRIRPHFLFNSLNAAMSLVRSDPMRAETVLGDLSDLFRMFMSDSRSRIPLEEEIALARQYLAIEEVRLGERLRVEWTMQRLPSDLAVPPLLLQPLLENAVRHGIEPMETGGLIAVRMTGMAREVVVVVENSYAPARVQPGNGIALANVKERLMLMYDLEAKIQASGDGKRYRVVITLPISRSIAA